MLNTEPVGTSGGTIAAGATRSVEIPERMLMAWRPLRLIQPGTALAKEL
jgi:hypothetical protein